MICENILVDHMIFKEPRIKHIPEFNRDEIVLTLKEKLGKEARDMITITNFVFSHEAQEIIGLFNMQFNKDTGRLAYDRTMHVGVLLYCLNEGITTIDGIISQTKKDINLLVFMSHMTLSNTTLTNFMEYEKDNLFKLLSLIPLVKLNDMWMLDFGQIYVDSTDCLVNGSRYYTINKTDIECLRFLAKHNLLHNNRGKSNNKLIKELNKLLGIYDENSREYKLIKEILKKTHFYTYSLYERVDLFENEMERRNIDFLNIGNIDSVKTKTKKLIKDFIYLMQQPMLNNSIALPPILTNESNDKNVMEIIINDLFHTVFYFELLQRQFGDRKNYKEISKILENAYFIFDSGYDSDFNIKILHQHGLKHVTMSKKVSTCHNAILRGDNKLESVKKPYTREDILVQGHNCYHCLLTGNKVKMVEKRLVRNEINKDPSIDINLKKHVYRFECECADNCPYAQDCKAKSIEDRIIPLRYEMYRKNTHKRYLKMYVKRFPISEGINGFYKGVNTILHVFGSNITIASNMMYLYSLLYNLKRIRSLKGTYY